MNREQENKLLDLYKKGLTSSGEEDALINQLGDSGSGSGLWFNFIKNHKKKAPKDLESQIWSSIQKGKNSGNRRIMSIALAVTSAAIVILALLIFIPGKQKEMSYEEKAALLEEAITLVTGTSMESTDREILYEDELIIIYRE